MIEIIAQLKQKGGKASFPLVDSDDVLGGIKTVNTVSELDTFPRALLKDGNLALVLMPTTVLYKYNQNTDSFEIFTAEGSGGSGDGWSYQFNTVNFTIETDVSTYTKSISLNSSNLFTQVRSYKDLPTNATDGIISTKKDYTDEVSGQTYKTGFYIQNQDTLEWEAINLMSASFSYNDLIDKPTINGVELKGDLTSTDLGIKESDNNLTDELKTSYDDVVVKAHEHSNFSTLEKFSEDADGNVLYNNEYIKADEGDYYSKEDIDEAFVKKVEIVDNLESDSTTLPLSAKQGKEIKTLIDNKVSSEDGKSLVDDTEIAKIHSHENQSVLEKFTEDENGKPLYNGAEITNGNVEIPITQTLTEESTKTEVPSAKATYESLNTKINKENMWVGTQEEYEAQKDTIPNGSYIYVTDDFSDGSHSHDNKDALDKLEEIDNEDDTVDLAFNGDLVSTKKYVDDKISGLAAEGQTHSHANKEVIDKLSVSDEGRVLYDGNEISPDLSSYATKDELHTHDNKEIIDKFSTDEDGELLYNEKKIKADIDLSTYDNHIANNDIHVTTEDKTNWNGKLDSVLLWTGTKEEYAADEEIIPDGAIVNITDDYVGDANVVNNLTTTVAGLALDARQGKVLNDKIATKQNAIAKAYDIGVSSSTVKLQGVGNNVYSRVSILLLGLTQTGQPLLSVVTIASGSLSQHLDLGYVKISSMSSTYDASTDIHTIEFVFNCQNIWANLIAIPSVGKMV